jgi:hypothetical protein
MAEPSIEQVRAELAAAGIDTRAAIRRVLDAVANRKERERTMTTADFTDLEPLTRAELQMVARHLGMISSMVCRIGEADLTRGKAKIKDGRCLWTKDGRRIDITIGGGAMIAGCSEDPDPLAPAAGTFAEGQS